LTARALPSSRSPSGSNRATAEEIAEDHERLTLAQVYTALAYYHVNRDEVEAELAEEEREATELERSFA
jgi:hypothetical protein